MCESEREALGRRARELQRDSTGTAGGQHLQRRLHVQGRGSLRTGEIVVELHSLPVIVIRQRRITVQKGDGRHMQAGDNGQYRQRQGDQQSPR